MEIFEACEALREKIGMEDSLWSFIQESMSEPQRHYHTLNHLEYIFRNRYFYSMRRAAKVDLGATERVIIYALFMHDIVYRPERSDNERRSAALATLMGNQTKLKPNEVHVAAQTILATATHEGENYIQNVVNSLDCSILWGDRGDYIDYAHNIRKEYAVYDEAAYRVGRTKVLDTLYNKIATNVTDSLSKGSVGYSAEKFLANINWEKDALARGIISLRGYDPCDEWAFEEILGYPEGLFHQSGAPVFECRNCGQTSDWHGEIEDFEIDNPANVCGRSPRCCP